MRGSGSESGSERDNDHESDSAVNNESNFGAGNLLRFQWMVFNGFCLQCIFGTEKHL